MSQTRRRFLTTLSIAASQAAQVRTGSGAPLKLWYNKPAEKWTDALPVGNGRLGAMVFGGVDAERLQLNEDTLWSGPPQKDWNNPEAKAHLAEVRRLVAAGDYTGADEVCKKMQGPYNQSYLPMANVWLRFGGTATEYRRELDLDTAIARVSYKAGDALVTREVFVSAPDQVIVVRVTSSRPLSFSVDVDSPVHGTAESAGTNTVRFAGKAPVHVDPVYYQTAAPVRYDDGEGKGMRFETRVQASAEGGRVRVDGAKLHVEDASACTILIAGHTGYRGFDKAPDRSAKEIAAACEQALRKASTLGYGALRKRHVEDHQKLFRRVSLEVGEVSSLPTDEWLKKPDAGLAALYFQYGRYLLIASSRPGTQAANLQGIWNEEVRPPWSSNWTANINVQMNYWPAETCALTECHEPMLQLTEETSRNGRKTAQVNYGARGWVSHHNIDIWKQSAPVGDFGKGSPTWANWQMSGPWLCQHLWEHYRFTGDLEFLRKRAYPVMKGSAEFCKDWLIEGKDGRLTTCPSFSTENTFFTPDKKKAQTSAGCTMDMALVREIFANTAAAAKALGVDAEFAAELEKLRPRTVPYQVGKYGQLQEWSVDFEESEPGQRHMSHMYPLYPGDEITPVRTPELARAAKVSLERRLAAGGAYTGWSRAWAIGFWARLHEGDRAWESIVALFRHSTGPNLFDTHPAGKGWIFQIDGNFGATAAMAEMLVQSHEDVIHLLPALPKDWASGRVSGLRARGNAGVSVEWKDGRALSAELEVSKGGTWKVRAPAGQSIASATGARVARTDGGLFEITTPRPGRYRLVFG